MSLVPYDGSQFPTRWNLNDFGLYLSYQAHRMYFWLRHVAPVVATAKLKQMERNVINDLPFVSQDGKRDIKRWLGHYDPSLFTGSIDGVKQEHGVYQNGNKGFNIYVTFSARNLKDTQCRLAIYFYFSDGTKLRDFNDSYRTTDGQVFAGEYFTPPYDNALYTDFVVFMPVSELHMSSGSYNLCFDISLYDERSKTHFATSPSYYHFTYTSN